MQCQAIEKKAVIAQFKVWTDWEKSEILSQAEVWTKHLLNTSKKCYCLS
jgi:hypothetical protein